MPSDIALVTLNAKYPHSSFGLRYLMANLGELREQTSLIEFGINQLTLDMLDVLLANQSRIIGFGVYIWNVQQTTALISALRRVAPETIIVLGGPEVSYETAGQNIVELADYVVTGEADLAFAELCGTLLAGERPKGQVINAAIPQPQQLVSPYSLYTKEDVAHRVIYVEASRGCPYTCEFCLSALDIPVRQFPVDDFLAEIQLLLDRGVRQFKFVDRTFNLNIRVSQQIMQFFLERYTPDLFLHFEMIPDRLPDSLRDIIAQFPAGALQFEVGVQTFNDEVCELISRRQDATKLEDNLRFLRNETGVHVHADLIVGLPGEDLASFASGFDRLVSYEPHEIQVGILKRLRGTPIIRHDEEWEMVYREDPPYEILSTKLMDAKTLGQMRRFARFWDMIANSGNFVMTTPTIWGESSPFHEFLALSEWLYESEGKSYGISLIRLAESLFTYLTEVVGRETLEIGSVLLADYRRIGRSDTPHFLRPFADNAADLTRGKHGQTASRQARHLAQ